MSEDFNSAFDDFLNERMGEAAVSLRKKNERYDAALSEYSELVQRAKNNEITDFKQAFNRQAELIEYIRDTESRYLFYTGMAMHKRMDDAVSSFAQPERFTE